MSRQISLFDLDPATYVAHPIHSDERTYSETNCYVDCLVELVHAAGLEADAMMGGAVAADFELDQWTFFKPSPDDLFRLYGIDLHEVQPYRGFPTLIATRLAAGQTVMPEVDSFYLPDVAATSYRTDHVKSTIVAESIDEDAKVLRYFHNTGYHELSGEDYDKLFATYSGDGHLPTYVELLRLGAGPVPTGDELRGIARELLADHLARRPADNPFTRFSAQLEADLPALLDGSTADYHAYAFHNPRMVGASMELLAGHVRWLFGERGEKAAAQLDDVVGGSKMLLFRLARQRAFDVAGVVAPMAEAYAAAVTELDSLVRLSAVRAVLEFHRVTPEPGPDADAVTHEFVAHCAADAPGVLEVGGIATVWDLLVDGTVVRSGRSMFERHVIDVEEGEHEVRIVVHPLTELLDTLPTKPRQRWRTRLVEDARLRWVRTQLLGRAPGFSPGPPVVGPYRPVTLVTGPRVSTNLSARLEGTTGVVEVNGQRVEFPEVELWWPHTHGTPRLHDVTVDGEVVGRVGFRTIENRSEDSLDLWVNGVRVFCRGAVWTPGDLAALDEAVGLGLNLVRVPGIAAYESDAFHDRCDELGLLVWQDLMFATFDYPLADPDFVADVTVEVEDQCLRLGSHPSTVVVCGSAEHEQQAAMFGVSPSTGYATELAALLKPLVQRSRLDAVWVDSSPSGGDPVIRVDTGIAQYFGVGAYRRDLPDVRHSRVRFAAECLAFSNLTDPVVPGGVPRDSGADWDFEDVREHYLRERYGADATEADAQRVTGEVMADVFGEWRRPESGCGGGIVLWLRDVVPGAGWGLLDHAGRPKPAALALAPTLQPMAVWFVDEGLNGLDLHVANDGPEPLEGTLTVGLLREDGSLGESADVELAVPAHGHHAAGVEALLGRFADVTYAYRFGSPQHAGVRARLVTRSGVEREVGWRALASLG